MAHDAKLYFQKAVKIYKEIRELQNKRKKSLQYYRDSLSKKKLSIDTSEITTIFNGKLNTQNINKPSSILNPISGRSSIKFYKTQPKLFDENQLQAYEEPILKKEKELEELKKKEAQKVARHFVNIPLSLRQVMLPKVATALFGMNRYETEIIKSIQEIIPNN